jgi:hypothetical protein
LRFRLDYRPSSQRKSFLKTKASSPVRPSQVNEKVSVHVGDRFPFAPQQLSLVSTRVICCLRGVSGFVFRFVELGGTNARSRVLMR